MLTKIPRVVDLSKQVLSTDRGMANTRMMLPSGRAKKLAETVLGKKPMIPPSLAKASVAAGVTFGAGLPLGMTDPKDVGATFAKMQVSLQDAFKQISDSVEDASKIPQLYFMQVQEGYNEEMQKQEAPEEIPPTIEEQALKPVSLMFAEGGELDMQETPMAPDSSMEMQPEMPMGEVSQMEMQEAQQGLIQILQVIETLIQQGLSEDEIIAFLAQYGITEAELEQAAQVLGVDMEQLLGGAQMEAPQQPMMMANGGALSNQDIAIAQSMLTPDNEPMFQPRTSDEQIFSLNARIQNLMTSFDMLVRNKELDRAQEVADQIDEVQQQIIAIQSQNVPQMGMGLGKKKN